MTTASAPTKEKRAAIVWLDRSHAFIATGREGRRQVTEVDRELDRESDYLLRVIRAASDCDRLMVMGPDGPRLAFEREYVALYRRPDRLIDNGLEMAPEPRQLVDRLRFVESSMP